MPYKLKHLPQEQYDSWLRRVDDAYWKSHPSRDGRDRAMANAIRETRDAIAQVAELEKERDAALADAAIFKAEATKRRDLLERTEG